MLLLVLWLSLGPPRLTSAVAAFAWFSFSFSPAARPSGARPDISAVPTVSLQLVVVASPRLSQGEAERKKRPYPQVPATSRSCSVGVRGVEGRGYAAGKEVVSRTVVYLGDLSSCRVVELWSSSPQVRRSPGCEWVGFFLLWKLYDKSRSKRRFGVWRRLLACRFRAGRNQIITAGEK